MNDFTKLATDLNADPGGRIDLMGLREEGSLEAICALYTALAKARPSFGEIVKSVHVVVLDRSGDPLYDYWYAPIQAILDATTDALSAEGLAVIQPLVTAQGDSGIVARQYTMLVGHGARLVSWIDFTPPVEMEWGKEKGTKVATQRIDFKAMAGMSTYSARYGLQRILGVNAEMDADDQPKPSEQADGARAQVTAPKSAVPEDLKAAIVSAFKGLGMKGPEQMKAFREVAGCEPRELTEESAAKLHEWLAGKVREAAEAAKAKEG